MKKTREQLESEVQRRGATTFLTLEVLLDIRQLLEELKELTAKQNKK